MKDRDEILLERMDLLIRKVEVLSKIVSGNGDPRHSLVVRLEKVEWLGKGMIFVVSVLATALIFSLVNNLI